MTIRPSEKDRLVGRDFVQILASRELRRFPKGFDPAATGDPFAGLGFGDALFHPRQEIVEGVGAFEIQSQLAFADSENMAMRISEAWDHGPAMEIHDLLGVKFPGFVV